MRNTRLKAALTAIFLVAAVAYQTGCQMSGHSPVPAVKLSVWWSDDGDRELITGIIEEFKREHSKEAEFEITVSTENITTCKETVLANPEAAADIYMFADDQFEALWRAGVLLDISENTKDIIADNGGEDSGACRAAMRGEKLYAYPLTAGNGYFLYYNSEYFTDGDVKSLDRILEISSGNGKKTAIDYSSGWYIYSFFKGAGLELGRNEDGKSNYCNWNASDTKYTGADVARAMLDIAASDGFISCDDTGFQKGVKDGSIIAGINGAWNAETVKEAWGDNFAAAKLPCYTLAGDSVQMCSFSGYKLLGINSYSEEKIWAMKLAQRLSDEDTQIKRFEIIGECPSNVNAASSDTVKASPSLSALFEQSQFAYTQSVADTFWNPAYIFGITIAGGNPDDQDIQKLLDKMVKEIEAIPEGDGK